MPPKRPSATETRSFILRFQGAGRAPRADLALLEAESEVTVIEFAPPRLMLVRATEHRLRVVLRRLPGWEMNEERAVRLPTRPARRPEKSP